MFVVFNFPHVLFHRGRFLLITYYNREGLSYLIEIRLGQFRQLFNSLDPSPLLEKDLNNDVEAYIIQAMNEFSLSTPLKLIFYVPELDLDEANEILPKAIHNYFSYRKQTANRELHQILRQGRISLLIGLLFLIICLSMSKLVSLLNNDTVTPILTEGLLIIGWVAMWRPLEIFLYDWWPIHYKQQVFDKLSCIPIEVHIL
jgi:hypothetical protein